MSGDVRPPSESSGRPSLSDLQGRSESPYRTMNPPMSARSQKSRDESPAKRFPPRKTSLSQDNPILEPNLPSGLSDSANNTFPASESTESAKPLPFIRPADIYKRMEEEREKERRSQESSRPSIDSNASRPRERDIFPSTRQSQESSRPKIDAATGVVRDNQSPARAPPPSLHNSEQLPGESRSADAPEDMDVPRKQKSTLDPVAERKSEYGFENMLKEAGPDHPSSSALLSTISTHSEQAEPLTAISASSNYSDRPDHVTASSMGSEKSLPHFLPVFGGVSDFGTDSIDPKNSTSRDNLSPVRQPAFEVQTVQPSSSALSAAPNSSPQQAQDAAPTGAMASDPVASQMRHNPSVGLRSVVHQGFDDSQEQVPQTPLSTADSAVRSNSASASDISPIISRAPTSAPADADSRQTGSSQHPSIAEEIDEASTTPAHLEAAKIPMLQEAAQTISEPPLPPLPPPPPVKDGYRRDYSIPSPGNSQARTPLTVGTVRVPEAEVASKSSATPTDSRKPWRIPPTTSEDPQDRESQTNGFRTNAALADSPLPATPSNSGALSGLSTRGSVRELAEKLESRSGRGSPAISLDQDPETPRPLHARLDSFRPSLPGGWESYSTNVEVPSHQQEQDPIVHRTEQAVGRTHMQRDEAEDSPVSSEDDDIPTAGPPKPRREESDYGPSKTAFVAAAAAGSALVGAFTSTTGLDPKRDDTPKSYEGSEDEPMINNRGDRDEISTRDLGNLTSKDQGGTLATDREEEPPAASPLAPSPPTKDTTSEIDTPGTTLGYFPPPLRTSRVLETAPPAANAVSSPTRLPMVPALSSETSRQDTENDRLRREIVRSLTPKSTRYEGESARPFDDEAPLPQVPVTNQLHSSRLDSDDLAEPEDSNARNLNSDLNQNDLNLSQAATALRMTEKALPQPNASVDHRRQPDASQARIVADPENRPALEQRFSWEPQPESRTSSIGQSTALAPASSPRAAQGIQGESVSHETIRPYAQPNTPPTTVSARAVPPMAPADTLRHVQDAGTTNFGEASRRADAPRQSTSAEPTFRPDQTGLRATDSNSLLHSSARETPFRDILSLGTPQDRIQAFNTNRAAVASQDTGLDEWLKAMGNQMSEHSDVLRNNGRLSAQENESLATFKPSPARSKFQRLASLANTNQSTDPEYDPSINNIPSGGRGNTLHIPVQGKKLLKDAGKIGGQAGVVAKGLFAKGKNKLRAGGGGSDKVAI